MILGSWGGMRKYLEKEMLAGSLQNRVAYDCTMYYAMDGGATFEVRVDGKTVKSFSMRTEIKYALHGAKPDGTLEFWKPYEEYRKNTPLDKRQEYDEGEFTSALKLYRSVSISEALACPNPIARMFAVLDRRAGKRTLEKLKAAMQEQPEWLQYFYRLRLTAEKILPDQTS